ncbi:iron complex outermembrane recepter protein [Bathymodiolus platifrons methanotrophic gill symbiont]|uniref:TonB-dependent receptor n=1 Tax=Bathymodiolus platifrons methanotrophic gill symbiont TaxID=113268 RepID=UPI000B40C64A|nr:TonB-dependent receptor [Bathymodiolus platifrons methanotrophic gill symbiont]GAW86965.1 iron complex outermembrane recepter protein [Bathymodiolus platifrons methanotrophic gill symbiont]
MLRQSCLLFLFFTSSAIAEDVQELEPVIVSAPLHTKTAETVHPVNILAGDELSMKQATTIGETLKGELGIHSMSFGTSVGQPVIRGQTGVRVLVLQNGLSSLDASGVSPDHANSTEALLAERIEVLRGPASLLYGSGAIGGIVNVIDNRIPMYVPEAAELAFEQRYNSVSNQWSSVLKHDGGLDHFAWHLDGFFRTSEDYHVPTESNGLGYVENTDAQSWSGTLGGSWIDDWGMLGFSYNHLDNNYGVPPVDELVRIDLKQNRYDLRAEFYEPFSWIEALKLRFAYNDYQHAELEDGVTVGTQFDIQGIEGRVELVHKAIGFIDHGAVGFQAQNKDSVAIGEEAFVPPSEKQNYAVFMIEDIHAGNIAYELGLRVEHQQIDAEGFSSTQHTPVSASLSALWNTNDNILFSLAFTHAQRAPDVAELFADGVHFAAQSYELGDEDLQLETSYNLELSFKTDFDWMSTELNVFHNWSNDYILQENTGDWFNLDSESFVSDCATNEECLPVYQAIQSNARFYGFEAQLALPLWEGEDNQFDLTLFSDFVRGELSGGGNVPRMPPLRYGFQFDYFGYDAFSAGLRLTRAEPQNHVGENETPTAGYILLDANVSYQVQLADKYNLLLFVKGNNLLNETIRNSTSFLKDYAPEPGRGAEIGIRVSF